jgi:hypothetical protein
MTSTLLQTITADLKAGVSYLEKDAEQTGLFLWNVVKTGFIALEPAALQLAYDVLDKVVTDAEEGKGVEQIFTDALNTVTGDALAALMKLGKNGAIQVIAGIQSLKGK